MLSLNDINAIQRLLNIKCAQDVLDLLKKFDEYRQPEPKIISDLRMVLNHLRSPNKNN